jgi:hypothetical protein
LDEPRDKDWAYKIAAVRMSRISNAALAIGQRLMGMTEFVSTHSRMQEQEKDYDRAAAEKRRAEQLRREQEQVCKHATSATAVQLRYRRT